MSAQIHKIQNHATSTMIDETSKQTEVLSNMSDYEAALL